MKTTIGNYTDTTIRKEPRTPDYFKQERENKKIMTEANGMKSNT